MSSPPVPCPQCPDGSVVKRQDRSGHLFWGCDRYPRCVFTSRHRPLPDRCPVCSSPYLIEKIVRRIAWAFCSNPACSYRHRITPIS